MIVDYSTNKIITFMVWLRIVSLSGGKEKNMILVENGLNALHHLHRKTFSTSCCIVIYSRHLNTYNVIRFSPASERCLCLMCCDPVLDNHELQLHVSHHSVYI